MIFLENNRFRLFLDSASSFTRTDNEFIEAASSAIRSVLEKLADAKIQVRMRLRLKARFPLGNFFRANKQKSNVIGW